MAHGAKGDGEAVSFIGGCQCGAVRYSITADRLVAYACHCRECQKQSASAFGISVPVFTATLTFEGETRSWRRPTDSGSFTNCHFCPSCGARLYHDGENRPGMVTIKGGTLDNAADLQPIAHIWIASKPDWVVLPEDVPHWEYQPQSQGEWMELLAWSK
ncbi:MAG: GFA family protein [Pseudomonadota bacterium]